MRAHDRADFRTAWPRIVAETERACARGAALVVLPEGSLPAYVLGTEPLDGKELARAARDLAALAQRYAATIVYGGAKIADGRTYNAAIALGPDGCELGWAPKQFLWHFDRRWYAPGASLVPVQTPVGTLGLLVCADGRIPSIAATLVERGAQLLVMPTAWVTSGRSPEALENIQADLLINVRARENGVPFVAANKCGVERESVAYCGKSSIVDAAGTLVARASERTEEIVFGEVTLEHRTRSVADASVGPPPAPLTPRLGRQRIAFTGACETADVERFAACAANADADVLFAFGAGRTMPPGLHAIVLPIEANDLIQPDARLRFATVRPQTLRQPRGLVAARLAGVDLFVWYADGDADWHVAFARARAAELRAFVLAFDRSRGRAFAVDPEGALTAGTFDTYRLGMFTYDPTRTAETAIAPATDLIAGLRAAEAIRAAAAMPA